MATQDFLKTLKTAKRAFPPSTISSSSSSSSLTPIKTLLNSAFNTTISSSTSTSTSPSHNTISSLLSSLSSHQLHSFLSDPSFKTHDCLRIFNLVLHNQSNLSFKPDLHTHFTLISRLIKSRLFSDAELLLKKLILSPNYRYPFSDFTLWVENYCIESKIVTKLFNMLLKMYSDHNMFDMAVTTFEYMVSKQVEIDERTCSVHLYALVKTHNVYLAFEFFRRMLDSSMEVSVFSLTVVVSGLCEIGELKMGRELVEEMIKKDVRPNVVTLNTLVDACLRRWEFKELDVVLSLMEREGVRFNDTTYKLLIEGYSGSSCKVDEAKKLLFEMQDCDFGAEVHLYYMVIKGYCRLGNVKSGYSLLRKMQEENIGPCHDIYRCLICAMCRVGVMDQVKELVYELLNEGVELNDDMLNALIDEYQKAGMMHELEEIKCMVKVKCNPDTLNLLELN